MGDAPIEALIHAVDQLAADNADLRERLMRLEDRQLNVCTQIIGLGETAMMSISMAPDAVKPVLAAIVALGDYCELTTTQLAIDVLP